MGDRGSFTKYGTDGERWYPTTPAEYDRMLRAEADEWLEQERLSFRYGNLPSVHELIETVAEGYETRTGPHGMEFRRKPVFASW